MALLEGTILKKSGLLWNVPRIIHFRKIVIVITTRKLFIQNRVTFMVSFFFSSKELGGGAILDMGCYTLQFQQYVFRGLKPIKIAVNGHLNNYGTDESCAAIFTYPDGKMAVVCTSARVNLPTEATVVGTKGTLKIPNFWAPTKLITPNGIKEWPLPQTPVPYEYKDSGGLMYEAENVRQCILTGTSYCCDSVFNF